MNAPGDTGGERRQNKRRTILDHFSFYVNVPKLGSTRLQVSDVSEGGIGFSFDTLGQFKLSKDEVSNLNFYLNQSLFLALKIQVVRTTESGELQQVGAIFLDTEDAQFKTFLTLVNLLDQLTDFASVNDHA